MSYEALTHIHLTTIVLSVLLFVTRFGITITGYTTAKWLNIAPHIINLLLIVSGLVLAVTLGFKPSEQPWLLSKLILLVMYIVLAVLSMKQSFTKPVRWGLAVVALLCVYAMANAAITKQVLFGLI
jgi:uncharacterized membrane protein SirB2